MVANFKTVRSLSGSSHAQFKMWQAVNQCGSAIVSVCRVGHEGVRHRFMKHMIWKFSLVMICHVKICQDPSPGPHYLPWATERSETVSGSASCSASPMPKSLGKLPRRRAPPCHRDLDPKMCCPRGPLTEATFAEPLMLCGPSELSGLQRRRKYLQIDQIVEQKRPKVPAQLAMEEMLRLKLRLFDEKLGGGMLKAMVGRRDLAQHILSFVNAERPLVDTAVGGKMFADSGSANVDLFFHSVPSMPSSKGRPSRKVPLEEMLEKAWEENPEVCLKQIFLIGSAREGKQDRHSFYEALQWLWWKDPATVLANLHHVPECNYWKALLEFLARLCDLDFGRRHVLGLLVGWFRGDGQPPVLSIKYRQFPNGSNRQCAVSNLFPLPCYITGRHIQKLWAIFTYQMDWYS